MKKYPAILFLFVLLGSAIQANGQQTVVSIFGTSVYCRASNGQLVPIFDDVHAAAAARSSGGARADFSNQNGFTIAVDPYFMNSLPRLGAFMVFYHECAHVALPMGVGLNSPSQERNADCAAIRFMVSRGLIKSWGDFQEAMSPVIVNGWGHGIDINRINHMASCLN